MFSNIVCGHKEIHQFQTNEFVSTHYITWTVYSTVVEMQASSLLKHQPHQNNNLPQMGN